MCGETKPTAEFAKDRSRPDQLGSRCRICNRAHAKNWAHANPALYKRNRRTNLLKTYGLSQADYAAKHKAQGGVCAICGQLCTTGMYLSVDHCHRTGTVRGLLCHACNTGIGKLKDSPELLHAAAAYITLHAPAH